MLTEVYFFLGSNREMEEKLLQQFKEKLIKKYLIELWIMNSYSNKCKW